MLRRLVSRMRRRLSSFASAQAALVDPPVLHGDLEGFQGTVEIVQTPASWRRGALAVVQVRVCNTGKQVWPAVGLQAVCLGYHWCQSGGGKHLIHDDGHRSLLAGAVVPGEQLTAWCGVKTPGTIGKYELEIDLFRNFGGWFAAKEARGRRLVSIDGSRGEDGELGFNYHDLYRKANLEKDWWTVVGPRSLQEFQLLGKGKLKLLVDHGLTPAGRVLDVGCGTGQLASPLMEYLSDQGAYVGTDLASDAVAFCRTKYCRPNFRFFQNDMATLPLSGETFDAIYLGSVFTHMFPEDIAGMLAELRRLLAASGFILADALHSPTVSGHTPSRAVVEIHEAVLFEVFRRSGLHHHAVKSSVYNSRSHHTIFKFTHPAGAGSRAA